MSVKALSSIKVKIDLKPTVENVVFRLHYRFTNSIYMVATALCTLYGIVGKQIDCMTGVGSGSFNAVVNSYCFIMSTFTVDRLHGLEVGREVPHPGVGPAEATDSITYHTYYQWVPFVLFVQGVMFYMPHWLWKMWEGGFFKHIIQDLSVKDYLGDNLNNYFKKEDRFHTLAKYIRRTMHGHKMWAYRFFFCELLNLGVVVATLFFTDWFLGGEFLTYGTNVFNVASLDPENRTDPMSYVFPRMAKCTFKSFGPSGTLQVRDMMCLIATNIINEKIYLFLWVWLVALTAITSLWIVHRFFTIVFRPFRNGLLKLRTDRAMRGHLMDILRISTLSDWLLLYCLAKNMERSIFSEFVLFLHDELFPDSKGTTEEEEEQLEKKLMRDDFILPQAFDGSLEYSKRSPKRKQRIPAY